MNPAPRRFLPTAKTATTALLLPIALHAQAVTFQPRVDFEMAQENAQQTVCADFNHDGKLDIATTMEGYNQGKVEVLFGDGQSDFGTSLELTSSIAWGLGLGDFNGDGWQDFAATSYGWAQHGVHVWMNNQSGSFTNTATPSTLASPPVGVATGDFDSDGLIDLAAVSESGGYAVDWFHGNGNGTFSAFHYVPNTTGLVGRRVYAGHFNSDSHLDLVAIHASGAMVLLNDNFGTGNFNSSGGISLSESMNSGAVADVDGDGRDDILTAGVNLRVWHNVGDGSFTLRNTYPTSTGAKETLLGDINGDGQLDALLIGVSGAQVFFGQGNGAFSAPQTIAAGVYPKSGAIGDWNGDGWNDIAISCQNYAGSNSYLSVYTQVPPAITASATAYGTGCGVPALGFVPDVNGRPRIGHAASATIVAAPSTFAWVAAGISNQWAGSVPLPASLAAIGMPGCDLLQSIDMLGLDTTPLTPSTLSFATAVPNAVGLLGAHIYLQGFAIAPGANPLQMVISNGIDWMLGNQ